MTYPPPGQYPPPGPYPPPPGWPPPAAPPPAKKRRRWPWVVGGFVALIALGVMVSPGQQAPSTSAGPVSSAAQLPVAAAPQPAEPAPARPDPTVIKVKQMGDDFEANQVAAEKKWGGQYVQFTAPVGNINSSGISFHDVTSKFSFTQVSCRLADENAVLNLAKDKPATVRGVVGDDQLLGVINLEDCEIVG